MTHDLVRQSPEESPWTEREDIKKEMGGDTYTDLYKASDLLSDYIDANSDVFGTADHVALFTV